MKKISFYTLFLFVMMVSSGVVRAEDYMCGGTLQMNNDCANNDRAWRVSCCPSGYRVQGVAYTDIQDQDHVDAVSAVCRSIAYGNDTTPSDFSRTPKTFVCDKKEVMSGVYQKDVVTSGGSKRDSLDGISPICETPKTGEKRTIENPDIIGGREGSSHEISLPKRVVGLAYRDLDKGDSDRADCVAIIVK